MDFDEFCKARYGDYPDTLTEEQYQEATEDYADYCDMQYDALRDDMMEE